MTYRADPDFMLELEALRPLDINACFNCGNCTAVCPLSTDDDNFPRRMIRLAQLGLKDELLGSPELWMCYNCGLCSETCPREAEPANFMMAARCYATAEYAPLNIGKVCCKNPLLGGFIATLLALFVGLFMYAESETMSTETLNFFGFVPYEFIHNAGLTLMVIFSLFTIWTIFNMVSSVARAKNLKFSDLFKGTRMNWREAFWDAVFVQSLAQKRYRDECDEDEDQVWYSSKWFVHAATMWGFLGLLITTGINFFLDIIGVKATGTFVPIWYPTRLLGTLSGLLFLYGISILLYKRIYKVDKAHSYSRPSDWIFLTLLTLSGVTGFIVEIALYLPSAPAWGYWLFLFHVAVSAVLLFLLPFTKFGHAIYRPVALYIHALKPVSSLDSDE